MIGGIDESGRGAMIGPLVIAGVVIDKSKEALLKKLGVKDSKKLTPKKREMLAEQIEKIAQDIIVLRVQPCKIDKFRGMGINLDQIEAMKMAEILQVMTNANKIYVDGLSVNPKRFKNKILEYMQNFDINGTELIVENYADETYIVVSAASIIAKVERDREIAEIKKKVNFDFGVGYSHDERTIKFVEGLIKSNKELPSYLRKSWVTTKMLQEKNWQRKIMDFFRKEEQCVDKHEN